jgi:hypothetical protein
LCLPSLFYFFYLLSSLYNFPSKNCFTFFLAIIVYPFLSALTPYQFEQVMNKPSTIAVSVYRTSNFSNLNKNTVQKILWSLGITWSL